MTWTAAKPTVPSWYWLRWPKLPVPCVVRVYAEGRQLRFWFNQQGVPVDECREWEWAGPIPEPDEG